MPDEAVFVLFCFVSRLKTVFLVKRPAWTDCSISEYVFVFVRGSVEHSDFSILSLGRLFLMNFIVVPNPRRDFSHRCYRREDTATPPPLYLCGSVKGIDLKSIAQAIRHRQDFTLRIIPICLGSGLHEYPLPPHVPG